MVASVHRQRNSSLVERVSDQEISRMDVPGESLQGYDLTGITVWSHEEVQTVFPHVVRGNGAWDRVIEGNMPLVISIAKRYQGNGIQLHDLIHEGVLGLMRAVEKFDYRRGNTFATYATWWIRQAINRAVLEGSQVIHVPQHVSEVNRKIKRVKEEYLQEFGTEPSDEVLAELLEIKPQRFAEIVSAGADVQSLEHPIGDDLFIGDILEDTSETCDPAEVACNSARLFEISEILTSVLLPREEQVIRLRFGIGKEYPRSLDEVGREMGGISRERVRQLEGRALRKLRTSHMCQALYELQHLGVSPTSN